MTLDRFTEILEVYDMSFNIVERNGDVLCAEIEFTSEAGEDVVEGFWFTPDTIVKDFRRLADEFDPDEHAELYINMRGQNGVPDTIRELIDDADWIKNELLDVATELEFQMGEEPKCLTIPS